MPDGHRDFGVTVAVTSTTILPQHPRRKRLRLTVQAAGGSVSLRWGEAAVLGRGLTVAGSAAQIFEFDKAKGDSFVDLSLQAISTLGTEVVSGTEVIGN